MAQTHRERTQAATREAIKATARGQMARDGAAALSLRAIAAEMGFDLVSSDRVGGGSDGNFTAALGIPTLDGLGIDGDGAHTLQEYGLISSISPRRRLMQRLLEML